MHLSVYRSTVYNSQGLETTRGLKSTVCWGSADGGFKMWHIIHTHTHTHTRAVECYLATIKNEILPCAIVWIDLENMILSQLVKEKYYITSKWNLKNNTNVSIYQWKTKLSMYLLIFLTTLPSSLVIFRFIYLRFPGASESKASQLVNCQAWI